MEHPGAPLDWLTLVGPHIIPGELRGGFEVCVAVFTAVHLLSRGKNAACTDGCLAVAELIEDKDDKKGQNFGKCIKSKRV